MSTKSRMLRIGLAAAIVLTAAFSAAAQELPPLEADALASLETSPRHGEWVTVRAPDGDSFDAWVVYPERSDNAPVVLVIHEIFGLTDWIRAVADSLAAEGFIAVAPDFLSGKRPEGLGAGALGQDAARELVSRLTADEVTARLDAAAEYAVTLPAARDSFGVVGFCWGGGMSFEFAVRNAELGAAVVYYGTSPATSSLAAVEAPVLGLYGGNDARLNATVPAAESELGRLGKSFEAVTYPGAGHAFLRNRTGANRNAAEQAWPRTIAFLREHLGE